MDCGYIVFCKSGRGFISAPTCFPRTWVLAHQEVGFMFSPLDPGKDGECSDYSSMVEVLPALTLETELEEVIWLSTWLSLRMLTLRSPVHIKKTWVGFPGGAVVENLPANAGDTGSSPGLGRSHMPRSD